MASEEARRRARRPFGEEDVLLGYDVTALGLAVVKVRTVLECVRVIVAMGELIDVRQRL